MRTVVEAARTMLHAKNLQKSLWAEAVNTAVHILNRSGTSPEDGRTPYELWYGKSPDLNKLRNFGNKVFSHVPKQLRKKWDAKSREGIFVGYEENTKGYRIYYPKERKVDIARDVIFKPSNQGQIKDTNNNTASKKHISIDRSSEEESLEEEEIRIDEAAEEQHDDDEWSEAPESQEDVEEIEDLENSEIQSIEENEEPRHNLRNRNQIKRPSRWQDYHTCLFGIT